MAKWGEGDPRWIVEERPDATNVNNWHWTEMNASPWSKLRLTSLLVGLEIDSPKGHCVILNIESMEGEASANNRKAKLIFLYEWNLKLTWQGMVPSKGKEISGSVEIPNLSDENEMKDVSINVSSVENGPEVEVLKKVMIEVGVPLIRQKLCDYVRELKEEYGRRAILPTKDTAKSAKGVSSEQAKNVANQFLQDSVRNARMDVSSSSSKVKTLYLRDRFKCTAQDIFNAFTSSEMIRTYTRAPCGIEPRVGGKFHLFDEMVNGEFIEMSPPRVLKMKWRMKTWPTGVFSTVSLTFDQKDDETEMELEQTGIPEEHYENTRDGWRRHYFTAIKGTYGFGALLM